MAILSRSRSKNLLIDVKNISIESNCLQVPNNWKVKKKRSACSNSNTEEKKNNTNQIYEGIVKEIKSFAKDEKEEEQFMEVADLVYFKRSAKIIHQEAITEIKRKYGKAEEVERSKGEPPLKRRKELHNNNTSEPSSSKGFGFMNSRTPNLNSVKQPSCPLIKRKFEKEKGKRVAQQKIPHEILVKEAEKREKNPPLVVVWKMIRMNGFNLKFLMEKTLLPTDMSNGHDRLSMPKLKVAREFLNEEEIEEIKNSRTIDVQVIEPCDLESSVKLSIWTSGSEVYVLRFGWRKMAKREENGLKEGIKVQIWCFRMENNQLCFLIVKANDAEENLGSFSGGTKRNTTTQQKGT